MHLFPIMMCAAVFSGVCATRAAADLTRPSPPVRPSSGPGSTDYAHEGVRKTSHGSGERGYFIFAPDGPSAKSAPVVVFLHGFMETEPGLYGAWIMHLVRRGNIVIYPRFQAFGTLPRSYLPNAVGAAKDAIAYLKESDGVTPDVEKFAIVGHSCGGLLAGSFAAVAVENGLPTPRAVMCVEPGRHEVFPIADFAKIPSETLLITVAGDRDLVTGQTDARLIFEGAVNVLPENRNMVIVQTDTRGLPWFVAGHASPAAIDRRFEQLRTEHVDGRHPLDAVGDAMFTLRNSVMQAFVLRVAPIEYMGYWRLFDSLTHTAFTGEDRDAALGDTPRQRDMGRWSDGVAVRELVVVRAE
jgi:acetyl esterase/lipase